VGRITHVKSIDKPKMPLCVVDERYNNHVSKRRKRRIPRYVKYIFYGFIIYCFVSFAVGGYQILHIKKEIKQLEAKHEEFLLQQRALEDELNSLQNPEVIEKLARESLGMVKKGETLVVPALPGKGIPKPNNINIGEIKD